MAIDQSTQGSKVLLFDRLGHLVFKKSKSHRQVITKEGWISHDLNEIYSNLLSLIHSTLNELDSDDYIRGLGITNQRETAAAWSKTSGEPLTDAVVWQDTRSARLLSRLATPSNKQKVYQKTGLPLSPYFSAAKFYWLLKEVPDVANAASTGDLCLGTIDSWLLYQLSNHSAFKTEPSNACRTQLFNIKTQQWDEELLKLFDVPAAALPEIVDSDALFGYTNFSGLMNELIPIHSILADSQAALFGHACREVGDTKITYGTGASIVVNIGKNPVQRIPNGLANSIAWRCHGECQYVIEGNVNYAGAVIKWLQDDVQLIDTPADTEKMALRANVHDQTYFVPAFSGLGAPYWEDRARAAFVGMSRTTGKNEIVKASLDGIAYQIDAILQSIRTHYQMKICSIKVDGGVSKNRYLMQFQSNISAATIWAASIQEISALGTAWNAGNALNFFSAGNRQNILKYNVFSPKIDDQSRTALLKGWDSAIVCAKKST
jgi:glycerol kinase